MEIRELALPEVLLLQPGKSGDHRGFFSEVFKALVFKERGIDLNWIQDNHSFSASRGVVRGLHFQKAPQAQAKLLRVTRGAIYDVAVDIRAGSPTYGRHVGAELSADNWSQLFVPVGFAHGFCTLVDQTEVLYKVAAPYSPECEGGIRWNDGDMGIHWPIDPREAVINDRDKSWPLLRDFTTPF